MSPGTVEVSRDRGVDARPLDVAEVRELDAEPFETVVMFGNNFGLVGTRATAPRVLGGLAAVTTDDPNHTTYHDLNRERGRLGGALRIRTRYERRATSWFDYLLVAPEELREVVAPTPWAVAEILEPNRLDETGDYVAELRKA